MKAPHPLWWLLGGLALAVLAVPGPAPIPARWARLRNLHPSVQQLFLALFLRIERETGGTVVLTSDYRGGNEASDYHYFGLAVDFNVIIKGVQYGLGSHFINDKAGWEATGVPAIIRQMGFRWGGDFTMPVSSHYPLGIDPVHADLGSQYPIAPLRARARAMAGTTSLTAFDGRLVPLAA